MSTPAIALTACAFVVLAAFITALILTSREPK